MPSNSFELQRRACASDVQTVRSKVPPAFFLSRMGITQGTEMAFIWRIAWISLFFFPALLHAQEVKYLDLSSTQQRTELRHPPSPPSECNGGGCIGGGMGGGSVADGAPDQRDPHALGVYLLQVIPTEIRPDEPFDPEFKILNTGRVPIELPIHPHLSDLQPADESVAFSYFSFALVVQGESEPESQGSYVPALGFVELYGSHEHDGTMIELRPGEWIRVRATLKLHTWPAEAVCARLRGGFWLRKNTYRPQPGGAFTDAQNLYPNTAPTPSIPVHFLRASAAAHPKK